MKIKRMKSLVIFFGIIVCFVSADLGDTSITNHRVKRWENGDMGMGIGDGSSMFRGTAGVDYPDLKTIPNTSFQCEDKIYEGGLYADVETSCQVYHVCHNGRKDSFLCGMGTIFNQQILACDYWYSADCKTAPSYYYVNSQIGNYVSSYNQEENNADLKRNHDQAPATHDPVPNYPKIPNSSEKSAQINGQKSQPCCCLKNGVKTPWLFPGGMMLEK